MSSQSGHPTLAHSPAPPTIFTLDTLSMTEPGSTLLDYVLTTSPNPLQTSQSVTQPTVATLTFVVSCPLKFESGVKVAQIVVALPVRDPNAPDEGELAMVAPGPGSVSIDSDKWIAARGAAEGVFTFTPEAPPAVLSSESLTITFTGIEISPLVGTAEITISEWASTGTPAPPSPSQTPSARGTIEVTKFPHGFYCNNFAASAAAIEQGGGVTLTWNASSNAACEMEYGGNRFPVSGQSWTVKPLNDTTVFKLLAHGVQNGQTVTLEQTTAVEVLNPMVLKFLAQPEDVKFTNPRQQVVITWITTESDGVDLLSSSAAPERLGKAPDPSNPKKITPEPGDQFWLRAYRKTTSGAEILSSNVGLAWRFLPVEIRFSAEPTTVSTFSPETRLSWDVTNADRVTLQGATVAPHDAQKQTPHEDTTYTLEATGAAGPKSETVTVKSYQIGTPCYTTQVAYDIEDGWTVGFTVTVTVTIPVAGTVQSVELDQFELKNFNYSFLPKSGVGIHSFDPLVVRGDASLVGNTWQLKMSLYHLGPPQDGLAPDGASGPLQAEIWVDDQLMGQLAVRPCAQAPTSLMEREALAVRAPGSTLLTYVLTTLPDPLQASPSLTEPAATTLMLIVSCPLAIGSANVAQIVLALPVRDTQAPDSSELAVTAPPPGCAAIVSTGTEEWIAAPGAAPGIFIFTPKGGAVALASQSLTITFTGLEISPLVGTAAIAISEWAAVGTPPSPPQPPSATGFIPVTKFPPGFFAANLAASAAAVDSGGTVTLTWSASSNAACVLEYDQRRFPVSGQSWTSPPLYATTVFILRALGTHNGQTVSLAQTTAVQVAAPIVVSVKTLPEHVGYGEPIELSWLTNDADGVYLLAQTKSGTQQLADWPPASDDKHPVSITPEPGDWYSLQAYKRAPGPAQVKSQLYPLQFDYLPVDIRKFGVHPVDLYDTKPSTVVSWDVANAVSVQFQGAPAEPQGSHADTPRDDTTYTLAATWVDGSVTTQTTSVRSHKILDAYFTPGQPRIRSSNVELSVSITIVVAAASVVLGPVTFRLSGAVVQFNARAQPVGPRLWQATASISIPITSIRAGDTTVQMQAGVTVNGQHIPNVPIRWQR